MDKDNIYVLRDIDCFMSVTEAIREQGLTLENRIIEKKVIESNYYLSKQLMYHWLPNSFIYVEFDM